MRILYTCIFIFLLLPQVALTQNPSSHDLQATAVNISDDLIQVADVSPSTITTHWQSSLQNDNAIRYRAQGQQEWIIHNTGSETSFQLKLLKPRTHYEMEVKTAPGSGDDSWSEVRELKTISRPNIMVIVADDGRYDNYSVTKCPSFFSSPNIDRIANEGVNFKYCFPSFSLCSPSRANIVSGLMSHHSGVVSNALFAYNDSLFPTVAEVLHDSGYYGIWVGKYGFQKFPQPGYDAYLESSNDFYWDTGYFTNQVDPDGSWIIVPGHKTNVFTDAAHYFVDNAPPGQPFFIFLEHKAPHVPLEPRAEDSDLYKLDTMPFPANFYPYSTNYASYLYECHNFNGDSDELRTEYRKYYELLAGVDYSVGVMLDLLEQKGILDSTLIIYTSDNGLLKGEHVLEGKQVPQEESIRLPMFIRYPKWFDGGTFVDDEMAMNIDIAPTMLAAAEIPNPLYTDGISMRDLVYGTQHRKELLYEHSNKDEDCTPSYRCIRDFNYKYVHDFCADSTEEFFDLQNDSLENFNQINNPAYQALIALYRLKLDTLRKMYGDTLPEDTIVPCQISFATGADDIYEEDWGFHLSPNPGDGEFRLDFIMDKNSSMEIYITDVLGKRVYERRVAYQREQAKEYFSLRNQPKGIYLVNMQSGGSLATVKYVKAE